MVYFFYDGPMLNIKYFAFFAILANLVLIFSSLVFFCRRKIEVVSYVFGKRGSGYWFYYYTRLCCTLICLLLSMTFILTWGIRLWIVRRFDPNLEMNIVKDPNPLLNSITSLPIVVALEIVGFFLLIFHYIQTLYMMRLVSLF